MLLQHGASLDAQDRLGRTPLHCALLRGQSVVAKHLVSRGASTKIRDAHGRTPLESLTAVGGKMPDAYCSACSG